MMKSFVKRDELRDIIVQSGVANLHSSSQDLDFKDLMRLRVNNILLVSSRYDFYTLIDDGQLTEAIFSEYLELNLHYAPNITRVYSGEAALEALKNQSFDLVITMLRLGDMDLKSFCVAAKNINAELPLVLLAYQSRALQLHLEHDDLSMFNRIFIWSGDRKLFLAIIKLFEDLRNAKTDCLEFGVRSIILVEDSPLFYSTYLPLIYTELIQQAQMLIEEGKNFADKLLRQRARPKILHATTFEEAWKYYLTFKETLLGIITDLTFKIEGVEEDNAGIRFIKRVRNENPDLPILAQSSLSNYQTQTEALCTSFADKNSRTLLQEVREFMKNNFGFGDFVFRMPDETEVGRAKNIRELRKKLLDIPEECLRYHASRDHFSNWLMARTRFRIAAKLKAVKVDEFKTVDAIRKYIITMIDDHLKTNQRGIISDFSREEFESEASFLRIGGGSMGGKARGLAFLDSLLKNYFEPDYFPDVCISIPRTIVICTDVFSEFMEMNNLLPIVVQNISDEEILRNFLYSALPEEILDDLRTIVQSGNVPFAIRSSSLLEDTHYQPFAGIYSTMMIPNSHESEEIRYQKLTQAIKFVYASTFFRGAKNYIEATGHRIEEERMAVIVQEIVGLPHEQYYYPHFSGVARSYNYYPFGDAKQSDGIVNLAVGLGKTIVDGGVSVQFCPSYPRVHPQFANRKDYFSNSQNKFFALDISAKDVAQDPHEDENLLVLDIKDAECHGTLQFMASTYSSEDDTLYEGVFRRGKRVVNFAPILHSDAAPLANILSLLLKFCETAMNCPVEIEFACTMGKESALPMDFSLLQVRPMVKEVGAITIDFNTIEQAEIVLRSANVLGNGIYRLRHVVFVKPEHFDPARTREIAKELDEINKTLVREGIPYLLIGPGRWGSSDPYLGIPVKFPSISGANAIIETSLPNMLPDPSQGSHFFQNLTSFHIAYFTTRHYKAQDNIDWDWLSAQPVVTESPLISHTCCETDLEILVDGQTGTGLVLKSVRSKVDANGALGLVALTDE